jgi:hypothetical protein
VGEMEKMKIKERYLTIWDLDFLADRVEKIINLCREKNFEEIEEYKETILSMYDFITEVDVDEEHCYVFLVFNQCYDYE